MRIITETEFRRELELKLQPYKGLIQSVSGPGRSGAIAAVYASYILGVPFVPEGYDIAPNLYPHLVVDTASKSGRTLRKYMRRKATSFGLAVFDETVTNRLYFWYEISQQQIPYSDGSIPAYHYGTARDDGTFKVTNGLLEYNSLEYNGIVDSAKSLALAEQASDIEFAASQAKVMQEIEQADFDEMLDEYEHEFDECSYCGSWMCICQL